MRKAFSFYRSHYDQMKLMNHKQKAQLMDAICEVQFLEKNIKDIKFDDALLNIVWVGIVHSIETSLKGYVSKQTSLNKEVVIPLEGGNKKVMTPLEQEEEKEEEEEKGKEEEQFTFSLKTQKLLSSTSEEYRNKLKEYISQSDKVMSYEDFYNQCEMKPYKYKNFKMAYDSWNKGTKQTQQHMQSFKQQDAQRVDDSIDNFLAMREQGFDLRKPNYGLENNVDVEVIEHDAQ